MTDHIYWRNGVLYLLDQRELPFRKTYVKCRTAGDVITAINNMTVRGAPLLGIVAAYGMVLGVKELKAAKRSVRQADIARIAKKLGATRPTAVNLFWALKRMTQAFEGHAGDTDIAEDMLGEALAIHVEDIENNRMLSLYGAELIDKGDTIMTHCNAGALATGQAGGRGGKDVPSVKGGAHLGKHEIAVLDDVNVRGVLCCEGEDAVVGPDKVVSLRRHDQRPPRAPHRGVDDDEMDRSRREVPPVVIDEEGGLAYVLGLHLVGYVDDDGPGVDAEDHPLHDAHVRVFHSEIGEKRNDAHRPAG
jgi:hypothetical protein